MTSTQTIELKQTTYGVPPVVHAVQNDTGRRLKMVVTDETVPSESTATLTFHRPDGTHYSINCTAGSESNEFNADITQALTQFGKVSCQLKVSGLVSTFTFILDVQEDTSGALTPQEGMTITEAINRAEEAADRAEAAAENLELDDTLTSATKAAQAKAVGDAIGDLSLLETEAKTDLVSAINEANQHGSGSFEKELPIMYLVGDTSAMSQSTAVTLQYTYADNVSKTQRTGWLKCKWQGESSLNYAKKNFNFTFYHDAAAVRKDKIEFIYGNKESKWTAKANWIDHSHARNILGARLWSDIVKTRHSNLPSLLEDSPRYGAVDGYPFNCYINGQYQGLYTMNIKKDDFTFGMDEDNPLHCAICGDLNNDGDNTKALADEFRLASTTGWEIEVPSAFTPDTSAGLISLINFVMSSTDADFKANLDDYLDVESAIDYYIFVYFIGAFDNLARNMILLTYDGGSKWYCSAYDLDSTFGMKAYGQLTFPSNGRFQEDYAETNSLLWQRLEDNFGDEIYDRYLELRSSVLDLTYIFRELEYFMNSIPEEDYLADVERWPSMPNPRVDHLQQIKTFLSERAVYVDKMIAGGATITELDSVTLSDSAFSFVEKTETGLNPTYFTNKNAVFTSYKRIDTTTGAVVNGSNANQHTTVQMVPVDEDSAVVINPDKAKCLDNIVLYDDNEALKETYSVWYNPYVPSGTQSQNHTNNTSFMFPLAKNQAHGVAGARIQLNASEAVASKIMVASLKGWTAVDESAVPTGTGDKNTAAIAPVSEGDIVFLRTINGTGDTADYFTGFLEYATQSATTFTKLEDTNEPLKWVVIGSGFTYVGFKVARALYANGGHLEYIVLSGGESNVVVETSLGWDNQAVTASISPGNATIESVVWTSSNPAIATVTPSLQNQYIATISAHAYGSATITCTVTDTNGTAKTDSATITVT